jgi:hypothetical protein
MRKRNSVDLRSPPTVNVKKFESDPRPFGRKSQTLTFQDWFTVMILLCCDTIFLLSHYQCYFLLPVTTSDSRFTIPCGQQFRVSNDW